MQNNPFIQENDLRELHQDAVQWARYCVGYDRELALEVVQQAYLKIVEGSARFAQKSTLKTWLFGVIRLTALECRRKQQVHLVNRSELNGQEGLLAPDNEPAGHDEDVSRAQLEQALGALSRSQREIIYLAFYREHSLSEIAEITGVSIGSVRTQYHRAKTRLGNLLSTGEQYEEDAANHQ